MLGYVGSEAFDRTRSGVVSNNIMWYREILWDGEVPRPGFEGGPRSIQPTTLPSIRSAPPDVCFPS